MKTRDKIVYAALELFNEHGERSITWLIILLTTLRSAPATSTTTFVTSKKLSYIFTLYSTELLLKDSISIQGQKESLTLLKHYLDSYIHVDVEVPILLRKPSWNLHLVTSNFILITWLCKKGYELNPCRYYESFCWIELAESDRFRDEIDGDVSHLIASGWLAYQSAMSPKAQITEQVVHQGMLQMIATVKPIATAQGFEQLTLLEDGVRALNSKIERYG